MYRLPSVNHTLNSEYERDIARLSSPLIDKWSIYCLSAQTWSKSSKMGSLPSRVHAILITWLRRGGITVSILFEMINDSLAVHVNFSSQIINVNP